MSNHPQKSGSLCSGIGGSLYPGIGGSLYSGILNNAFKKYAFNTTTLLNYANRRSKKDDIAAYLMQKTDLPKTIFND